MVFHQRSDDGTIDIFLKDHNGELEFYKNVDTLDQANQEKDDFFHKPMSKREMLEMLSQLT